MANSNDFFPPFATGTGANVLAPSTWAVDPARTAGFSAGIAPAVKLNTAWRQASFVATMIAQFTADFGPGNVTDNGNLPAFEAQFEAALISYLAGFFQKTLLTNTTFFINNSIGSDTLYDGTSATIVGGTTHGPWASLTHAIQATSNYNLGGNTITLQLGLTGVPYTPPPMTSFQSPSSGTVVIQGNSAAQSSYVISGTPGAGGGIISITAGTISIVGVTLNNVSGPTTSAIVQLAKGASLFLQNVTLASNVPVFSLISSQGGSIVTVNAGCIMAGSGASMWSVNNGGLITQGASVATSGTPSYSSAVVIASIGGSITQAATGFSWTGSGATGVRFNANSNGVINSATGTPNTFWPGTVTGTTASGGQSL